ncbi:MAG: hypothetical protein HN719_13965 [Alphaproteobacteria bacterium]|jgi:hypothetical protein|nr:hypothetical protein [Alphaproteobacteria bacterium]
MRFLIFILVALLIPAPAPAQTYKPWTDPKSQTAANERLQSLVDQLNALIDAGEKSRAADNQFLRDLRGLAKRYDTPRRTLLLSDDFQDGDFTRNPNWTVTSGQYWVERGWGLRSAVKTAPAPAATTQQQKSNSGKDVAAAIFGQILQQAIDPEGRMSGTSQTAGGGVITPAAIQTRLDMAAAFAVELEFSSWLSEGSPGGRLEIGPYQGTAVGDGRADGYVLAYSQGGGLELIRTTGRGSAVIDSRPGPFHLEDKKPHRLEWTRRADGLMTVSLDGREIMAASDRTFKQNFDGLRLVNRGGDYIVKRIAVNAVQ